MVLEENVKQSVAIEKQKIKQNVVVIDEQEKSNINIMEFENKIILMFITLILDVFIMNSISRKLII